MMKSKYLFQSIVLIAVLVAAVGGAQPAYAQPNFDTIIRELTYWNATFSGYVDADTVEKWPMILDATYEFEIIITPTSGDLVPLIRFLDQSDAELASGTGSLITTQPAGNYFIQVEPESGSGFYELTIRQILDTPVTTEVAPPSINVGDTATVTVSLNEVPVEGYTSAEFTCTYPLGTVSISNILLTDLFGTDSASAINDPQDGSFIVAVAGSNGQRAMTGGVVLTFDVTGLLAGQAEIICLGRASTGDSILVTLESTGTTLTIEDVVTVQDGTLVGQVLAGKTVTVTLYDSSSSLFTSVQANPDGTFSVDVPPDTYTVTAEASGFLRAEGPAVVTEAATTTMATITLLAGDIDGNDVIDQFDAMTIGMSYNTATPDAADLNADGVINVLDLELLAANYRATGPLSW